MNHYFKTVAPHELITLAKENEPTAMTSIVGTLATSFSNRIRQPPPCPFLSIPFENCMSKERGAFGDIRPPPVEEDLGRWVQQGYESDETIRVTFFQ